LYNAYKLYHIADYVGHHGCPRFNAQGMTCGDFVTPNHCKVYVPKRPSILMIINMDLLDKRTHYFKDIFTNEPQNLCNITMLKCHQNQKSISKFHEMLFTLISFSFKHNWTSYYFICIKQGNITME
jgi:hypothetical protein